MTALAQPSTPDSFTPDSLETRLLSPWIAYAALVDGESAMHSGSGEQAYDLAVGQDFHYRALLALDAGRAGLCAAVDYEQRGVLMSLDPMFALGCLRYAVSNLSVPQGGKADRITTQLSGSWQRRDGVTLLALGEELYNDGKLNPGKLDDHARAARFMLEPTVWDAIGNDDKVALRSEREVFARRLRTAGFVARLNTTPVILAKPDAVRMEVLNYAQSVLPGC